ncbi:MAG: hypothetical protein LV480_11320 [Methylacidiphilales bacterium]|nr:hypothetical protein [Candidatus Methylacidiphilales bacterium]
MKGPVFLLLALGGCLWLSTGLAAASSFCLTSPDKPAVWYNRSGDKVSEYLAWDDAKEKLVLLLSYNRVEFLSDRDQTYYDNFQLAFPTVRLDRSTDRLYFVGKNGREITIGHLEPGILAQRVVLDDGVQLSAHRRNGIILASIASTGASRQ